MDAARVGLVIWGAVLGYWLLYHGVQRLSQLGQPAHGGAGGQLATKAQRRRANPAAYLAQQPAIRG